MWDCGVLPTGIIKRGWLLTKFYVDFFLDRMRCFECMIDGYETHSPHQRNDKLPAFTN